MKIVLFTLILSFSFLLVKAQDLESCGFSVLSETGEKFTIWVNGSKHNKKTAAHVLVPNIATDLVSVKVDWENPVLNDFEKKIYLRLGEVEHYRLKKKGKNEFYLSFDRSEPLSFSILQSNLAGPGFVPQPHYNTYSERENNYFSNSCHRQVSDRSAHTMFQIVQNESFESDKMKRAKEAVTRSCLDSRQIGWLVSAFSYESSRLEFAKFAYQFVYDKGAYMIVADFFEYSSSRDNLERFIGRNGRNNQY